ncbi:MAG: hypothetical protein NTW59_00365 [Candidatus Diapherotrites archaeon]|nr:hypothetical protein [Candidatus Diapherotrites archaeon]
MLQLDEIIAELQRRVRDTKSLRNRVLLQQALEALSDYKKASETQM